MHPCSYVCEGQSPVQQAVDGPLGSGRALLFPHPGGVWARPGQSKVSSKASGNSCPRSKWLPAFIALSRWAGMEGRLGLLKGYVGGASGGVFDVASGCSEMGLAGGWGTVPAVSLIAVFDPQGGRLVSPEGVPGPVDAGGSLCEACLGLVLCEVCMGVGRNVD